MRIDARGGLIFFLAAAGWAVELTPNVVRQGETVRVSAPVDAALVRVNGRTSRVFPSDGGTRGLLAIPVLEKPGEYTVEVLNAAGAVMESSAITVRDARYPTQNVVLSTTVAELRASSEETEMATAFRDLVSDVRFWQEPFTKPVPGCLTSRFGVSRMRNGKPTGDYHGGVDLRAREGQSIRATAAGTIRIARQFTLRGGTVGIDHGQGLTSMYLHMSKVDAKEGARVQPGDVIGYAGSTGRSTAPHLHWAIYVNGIPVAPCNGSRSRPARRRLSR
jgi:murein DD-endopeptidase MepM/ murein hydrolase activator NlpD